MVHPTTTNHSFARPDEDTLEDDWGTVINQELIDPLEERVVIRGTDAERSGFQPYADALYLSTDTHEVHLGDGSAWSSIGHILDAAEQATETWVSSNFNNYTFSESHTDLTDVNPAAHHEVFEPADYNPEADTHDRYTDTEAVAAVEGETTPISADISGDADTVDGQHYADIQSWVDSNYNNYTFSESYNDLTDVPATFTPESHGNTAHSQTYAVDGDAQPPETHDNTAHSETYATTNHGNTAHSDTFVISGEGDLTIQLDGTDGAGVLNFKTS